MKIFSYSKNELKRLLKSKVTWLAMLLCLLAPFIGFFFPVFTKTANSDTSLYLGNPVLACGVISLCVFFILALYNTSREKRNGVERTTQSIVFAVPFQVSKLIALLALGIIVISGILLSQFFVWSVFLEQYFSFSLFIIFYASVIPIATWIGALLGLSFYQIFRNTTASLLLFLVLVIFGFSSLANENPFLSWINPLVPAVSDSYSNAFMLRTVLFTRYVYLLIAFGLWFLSLLCIRRYQKNIGKSFLLNFKKIYLPILCAFCFLTAGFSMYTQPFFDRSTVDYSYYLQGLDSIIPEKVVIESLKSTVTPNLKAGTLTGNAIYKINNSEKKEADMSFILNTGYKIKNLVLNDTPIPYKNLHDDTIGENSIVFSIPAEEAITLKIEYEGFPKMMNIRRAQFGDNEIGTEFLQLQSSSFNPIIATEEQNSYPVDATMILPSDYTALSAANPNAFSSANEDGTVSWNFKENSPYVIFFAGKFELKKIEFEDEVIDFYFKPNNQVDSKKIIEMTKKSLEYNTKHYGPRPMEIGNENTTLQLLETSIFQFGGYAMPGFSCVDESCFSSKNLNDSLTGATAEEVLLHELTHQWWGGLGKQCEPTDAAEGWTDEGLTVYTTYRMVKELKGEAYAKQHYMDVWQKEVNNMYRSFYYTNPNYLETMPSFLSDKIKVDQKRIKEYCEMPLKIFKAEQLVGSEEKMDQILYDLMQDQELQVLTYEDFLTACNLQSEELTLD